MVLRLDPNIPLVWRTPDTLQLGVARRLATIENVSATDERIISALQSGVPRSTVDHIAAQSRLPRRDVDDLLGLLAPALHDTEHDAHRPRRQASQAVLIDGTGPTADRLADHLGELGIPVQLQSGHRPAAVVIVAHHVVTPGRYRPWVARDVPHLPIVFGEEGVRVGPLVEPGRGPCLYCLDLARSDADPAWAAIAAQLALRSSPSETPLLGMLAATLAVALVSRRRSAGAGDSAGRVVTLSPDGGWTRSERLEPHPECGCRALPGTATVRGSSAAAARPTPS